MFGSFIFVFFCFLSRSVPCLCFFLQRHGLRQASFPSTARSPCRTLLKFKDIPPLPLDPIEPVPDDEEKEKEGGGDGDVEEAKETEEVVHKGPQTMSAEEIEHKLPVWTPPSTMDEWEDRRLNGNFGEWLVPVQGGYQQPKFSRPVSIPHPTYQVPGSWMIYLPRKMYFSDSNLLQGPMRSPDWLLIDMRGEVRLQYPDERPWLGDFRFEAQNMCWSTQDCGFQFDLKSDAEKHAGKRLLFRGLITFSEFPIFYGWRQSVRSGLHSAVMVGQVWQGIKEDEDEPEIIRPIGEFTAYRNLDQGLDRFPKNELYKIVHPGEPRPKVDAQAAPEMKLQFEENKEEPDVQLLEAVSKAKNRLMLELSDVLAAEGTDEGRMMQLQEEARKKERELDADAEPQRAIETFDPFFGPEPMTGNLETPAEISTVLRLDPKLVKKRMDRWKRRGPFAGPPKRKSKGSKKVGR
uniref:Uncharacterized protein n=1 Tax=Chromera velia CCMP2878 TaxID=1169474 RepID=A0A0G4I1P2_9ALVE|mmetsp:Transcript_42084/g.83083  ORF Transcript_42084/g.83083 Transcript_42084/m.83083 type:complete len:462 (-) Transcript_42084:334-1719(-)|eukprot:Cvel_1685.t1-p1 / transcript=Cvel_1685.t1 / gene=Cvel_1685 / organism=Chromera_velia_CCMP2878 / gene_product=hypothetical protein / transcript_product=hypothetical protein / location=Cvel_scaffold60:125548-131096(+) / protein_length=461 / sequence_SO=supercontig / SO=protein_coding / is_pseudo=false